MAENQQDVRWRQRYQNLCLAVTNLDKSLQLPEPDIFQRAGMMQFFEMSFELAWKTLKDFLQYEGVSECKTPRSVIKKAFEIGLIIDGEGWLRALEDRNLTSHAYDEDAAREIEDLIRKTYFPLIRQLVDVFKAKQDHE